MPKDLRLHGKDLFNRLNKNVKEDIWNIRHSSFKRHMWICDVMVRLALSWSGGLGRGRCRSARCVAAPHWSRVSRRQRAYILHSEKIVSHLNEDIIHLECSCGGVLCAYCVHLLFDNTQIFERIHTRGLSWNCFAVGFHL